MIDNIHWLGHASFKITHDKTIYIDPYEIEGGETADIILITHNHYDHCSLEDIEKIKGPQTIIITTSDTASQISGNVKTIKPGDTITEAGISIEAVPAYNVRKSFHPKENNWVGYIITIGDKRVYHTGDSDAIPEMSAVKADIVLIPVGGTYTMSAEEAAQVINKIMPEYAIPMHYGTIIGSREDAQRFVNLSKVPVKVLKKE